MAAKGGSPRVVASGHPPRRSGGSSLVPLLIMAFFAVFAAVGLGRFGYSSLLPSMQQDLGFSNTQAGALASWNLAGYLIAAVVAGELSRRFGPRRVIAAGLLVSGVAMLFTAFANGVAMAAVARLATGVGAGAVNVPVLGMVGSWFSAKRRGLASGVVVSGSSLALVIAGPFVPYVVATAGSAGWRICWFVFGVAALLMVVGALRVLRDQPDDESEEVPMEGSPDLRPGVGSVYRSSFAWRLGAVYFTFGFSYMIYLTFFVRRLTGDLGMSQASAGTYFMVLGWASLLCGVLWGSISDFTGRRNALALMSLVQMFSYLAFALWTTPVGLTVSAVLFGLTAWSMPGVIAASCGDVFGRSLSSTAVGFLTLFLGVAQMVGPLVGGALADATSSFASSYLVAAAVVAVGAVAALFVPKTGGSASAGAPKP